VAKNYSVSSMRASFAAGLAIQLILLYFLVARAGAFRPTTGEKQNEARA
jgi:hypothetical protein